MSRAPSVLALIPARAGSKGVPHKNVRVVAGKPLIAWSIEQARASQRVDRVIVSTDSDAYAEVARKAGAEAPFLRPDALAGDLSTDLDVFEHALAWLAEQESYEPDIVVHLRPTSPLRGPDLIDRAVAALIERPDVDSVRTVCPVEHPPFKMWHRADDGMLAPVVPVRGDAEPWNAPRQSLPASYLQTANVDVVRTRVIRERHSMTGDRIYGLLEAQCFDVDTEEDLQRVDRALRAQAAKDGRARMFCFDIDGVIATVTPGNDYALAQPIASTIEVINALHAAGHRIVLFTARGSGTGLDWESVTAAQMAKWGVKHHELRFGKPPADYFIDDKLVTTAELRALTSAHTEGML